MQPSYKPLRYVLRPNCDGDPDVTITEPEWRDLAGASKILVSALAIEEKYHVLISNFIDVEKEIVSLSVAAAVRYAGDRTAQFEARSALNVRIMSYLTATRLYLDRLPPDIGNCSQAARATIKEFCSEQYDTHFAYRFISELRNFAQHRALPVGIIAFRPKPHSSAPTIEIWVGGWHLAEIGGFKKKVLEEIGRKQVDLRENLQKYMTCVSAIHNRARELTDKTVSEGRAKIESAHERFERAHGYASSELCAQVFEGGPIVQSVPLTLSWDEERIRLQKINR